MFLEHPTLSATHGLSAPARLDGDAPLGAGVVHAY